MNLYKYARNNATNLKDPYGLFPFNPWSLFDPCLGFLGFNGDNPNEPYNPFDAAWGAWDEIWEGMLDPNSYNNAVDPFINSTLFEVGIATTIAELSNPAGWLFGRGGLLNNNPFFRIGWSWKGTRKIGFELFRIAIGQKGSKFHFHFDFWDLFKKR